MAEVVVVLAGTDAMFVVVDASEEGTVVTTDPILVGVRGRAEVVVVVSAFKHR
jgi:hypothetical protein